MSIASHYAEAQDSVDVDRNLALLGYGLLFFAIFFAGVPALVAVAIAYARSRDAGCTVRSHHRFQIYIFWVGFALTALAALSGLAAVLTILIQAITSAMHTQLNGLDVVSYRPIQFSGAVAAFSVAAVALGVLTGVWLLITSSYGFIQLATHQPIRQTAR
ncbi:MAG TPA: hypothetical protein VHY34_09140 [Caulobacteraceae bacterium]|jgi:uncharacterized membrane protein|nr:hypothetical protein [Caulobacteraceae bacterium]